MTPPKPLDAHQAVTDSSVDPTLGQVGQVERGAPATAAEPTPVAPPAAPARDAARDAATLRGMGGFGGGRANPLLASNAKALVAERGLPGGSVSEAWGRADEFGPIADRAAHWVASRHPELFPELA